MIFFHFQVWIQFCGIGSILRFGSVLKRAGSVLAPDPVPVKGRFGPGRVGPGQFFFRDFRAGPGQFQNLRAGPGQLQNLRAGPGRASFKTSGPGRAGQLLFVSGPGRPGRPGPEL